MSTEMIVWRCEQCGATTEQLEAPEACGACGGSLVLWLVRTSPPPPAPPDQVGPPDVPVALWLQDRSESRCLFCHRSLAALLPQGFVGYVVKAGFTFPIGAACERCARRHTRGPLRAVGLNAMTATTLAGPSGGEPEPAS